MCISVIDITRDFTWPNILNITSSICVAKSISLADEAYLRTVVKMPFRQLPKKTKETLK
jgi:hypothetical protein